MDLSVRDEKFAVKYLLGQLPEAEQTALEERFFHDAEFSHWLSEVEDDLVDRYVREQLSPSDRERFEGHFLVSARRREKVEFARALLQNEQVARVDEAEVLTIARQEVRHGWWENFISPSGARRPALFYGLAVALLVLLAGSGWLVVQVRQLQQEIAGLKSEREGRERQSEELREAADEQRRRSDELAEEKARLEEEAAQLRLPAGRVSPPTAALSVFTFTLSASARSDEGAKPLSIPQGAIIVRVRLNLNPADNFPRYQVKLQTASGEALRTWKGLRATSIGGRRVVLIDVPSSLLRAAQYELALSGISASGAPEDLGYYYFEVSKN